MGRWPIRSVLQRLEEKILPEPNTGCWLWTGAMTNGYGNFRDKFKVRAAHIAVYEYLVGQVPENLELDHLCRNSWCVNPRHLEPVSHALNVQRGLRGNLHKFEVCNRGHEITVDNIYLHKNTKMCLMCRRANWRAAAVIQRSKRRGRQRNSYSI